VTLSSHYWWDNIRGTVYKTRKAGTIMLTIFVCAFVVEEMGGSSPNTSFSLVVDIHRQGGQQL